MQRLTKSPKWFLPRTAITIVIATLTLGLVQAIPAGATTPPPLLCGGVPPTIVGTENFDRIIGTEGNDVIIALGGDDYIEGRGGKDIICGGSGNDSIDGGPGRDRLFGGSGNDNIVGGAGKDRLYGQKGDDSLAGADGRDYLRGGSGNDTLLGGLHTDVLLGDQGSDTCVTDPYDAAPRSCEATDRMTYRTIVVTPTGNGDDPTGSNFGDAYFAGGIVRVDDPQYGLPVSAQVMTSSSPIRVRVPSTAYLSISRNFPYEFVAIGGMEINSSTPRNVSVEVFCCALY